MTQYIDKSALAAKINGIEYEINYEPFTDEVLGKRKVCEDIKDYIDTLEVKDVDINKEISQYIDANFGKATIGHKLSLRRVAKHFFELGINSKLSWQDMRKIAEIGEEFMNSEESDNLSEEEYYIRILDKFKAQKGKG